MKRTIFCLLILTSASLSFAGNVSKLNHQRVSQKAHTIIKEGKSDFSCTVSVSGTLGPEWGRIVVSCTVTASTCTSASDQAVGCVRSTVNAVKRALK